MLYIHQNLNKLEVEIFKNNKRRKQQIDKRWKQQTSENDNCWKQQTSEVSNETKLYNYKTQEIRWRLTFLAKLKPKRKTFQLTTQIVAIQKFVTTWKSWHDFLR